MIGKRESFEAVPMFLVLEMLLTVYVFSVAQYLSICLSFLFLSFPAFLANKCVHIIQEMTPQNVCIKAH